MNEDFNDIVSRLKIAHSGNLISIIVYGSAVAAPGNVNKNDYHLLVITKTLSAEDLNDGKAAAKEWVRADYALPIYFTEHEFSGSADVFAIEFRHMKRAYRVLHGEDLLTKIHPTKAHLRLQVEYEMRGKLLRLRSLYLPASDTTQSLLQLMTDSAYSFAQFMRPVLEILGEEPPLSRLVAVRQAGAKLKLDISPFEKILRIRESETPLTDTEAQKLFASYIDCLAQIIAAINKL
jgi:hypothetical protein